MKPVKVFILGTYDKELRRSLTDVINNLEPSDCSDESIKTLYTFFRNLDKSIMKREYLQKVSDKDPA